MSSRTGFGLRTLLAAVSSIAACGGTAATFASGDRISRGIAFFEARYARDSLDYLSARQLVNRYVTRFGLEADLADVARAETLARRLTELAPDPARSWARLSSVLLMQHRFAEALAAAEHAITAEPADAEALGALADAALAAGRYQLGHDAMRRMPQASVGTLVRRAGWLDATGHGEAAARSFERACRALERAAAPAPALAWCYTEWGNLIQRTSGPRAGETLWRRALRVVPGYRGALESLADLDRARGRWSEAARRYAAIATGAHPDLYLRLAEVRRTLGDVAGARDAEREFARLALRPEVEPLYGPEIATYLLEQGPAGQDSALAVTLREVERRPTVESHDLLAWVRFRRGEANLALAASNRALEWGAAAPTALFHRALIFRELGRKAEGDSLLHHALELWTQLAPHAQAWARARRWPPGPGRVARTSRAT